MRVPNTSRPQTIQKAQSCFYRPYILHDTSGSRYDLRLLCTKRVFFLHRGLTRYQRWHRQHTRQSVNKKWFCALAGAVSSSCSLQSSTKKCSAAAPRHKNQQLENSPGNEKAADRKAPYEHQSSSQHPCAKIAAYY